MKFKMVKCDSHIHEAQQKSTSISCRLPTYTLLAFSINCHKSCLWDHDPQRLLHPARQPAFWCATRDARCSQSHNLPSGCFKYPLPDPRPLEVQICRSKQPCPTQPWQEAALLCPALTRGCPALPSIDKRLPCSAQPWQEAALFCPALTRGSPALPSLDKRLPCPVLPNLARRLWLLSNTSPLGWRAVQFANVFINFQVSLVAQKRRPYYQPRLGEQAPRHHQHCWRLYQCRQGLYTRRRASCKLQTHMQSPWYCANVMRYTAGHDQSPHPTPPYLTPTLTLPHPHPPSPPPHAILTPTLPHPHPMLPSPTHPLTPPSPPPSLTPPSLTPTLTPTLPHPHPMPPSPSLTPTLPHPHPTSPPPSPSLFFFSPPTVSLSHVLFSWFTNNCEIRQRHFCYVYILFVHFISKYSQWFLLFLYVYYC